ncbi:uncharacterized protein LOC142742114 isoform X2 [Rhinoderma darwinii]
MDYKARECAWRSQMEQVFKDESPIFGFNVCKNVSELQSKYTNLLHRRMKVWWNKTFLENYIQRNLVPRGLRIQIFPSFPIFEEEFTSKWEEVCNQSSRKFMELLVDLNQKMILSMDEEIESVQAQLFPLMSADNMSKFKYNLDAQFVEWEKDIQDTKSKKFSRDIGDFQNNKVYRWRRNQVPGGRSRTPSISSVSSQSEADNMPYRPNFNTRPKRKLAQRQVANRKRPDVRDQSSRLKVINLSTHTFSNTDLELIAKGLTFSPSTGFDMFSAVKDLHIFGRSLIFKKWFDKPVDSEFFPTAEEQQALKALEDLLDEHKTDAGNVPACIRIKSKKFPALSLCPAVDLFIKSVTQEFWNIPRYIKDDNLTPSERNSLKQLQKINDVIFKAADKGGNVVVWPCTMYEAEANRQLRDKQCYKKLTFNPLSSFRSELQVKLLQAVEDNIISKELNMALSTDEPTIPTLYLLPKIHKNEKIPPGRPIISGRGSLTEGICKFIDFHLKNLVINLPSYIRDTADLLQKISGVSIDSDMLLVTIDVESLYTCIKHEAGIRAVKYFLSMSELEKPLCSFIVQMLEYILTHNFFVFNGCFYLQLQGTAMGAACAPSYANLFLGLWERNLFSDDRGDSMARVLLWARYIDDILVIWKGTHADLDSFMIGLNKNDENLKFTYKAHPSCLDFLDVKIFADEQGFLHSDVFRKETSVNALLHSSSSHPSQTIQAIPIGQFLRIRRICSSDSLFERQANDLKDHFLERGYSMRSIKKAYQRAKRTPRDDLLFPKKRPDKHSQVRFITGYHSRWPQMREILKRYWPILLTDPTLDRFITKYPSVTARRSKNLKDHLVKSHYDPTKTKYPFGTKGPKWGCKPCGQCVACPNVDKATTFTDASGSKTFNITHSITCTTKAVVYYAVCPCPKIYVGLTSRELKVRVREHMADIKRASGAENLENLKPVARHFKMHHSCDPSKLKVRGIDHIICGMRGGAIKQKLAQCETRWIWTLGTMFPHGLNESLSYAPFL